MVDKSVPAFNVSEKLDQIRIACGYASDRELAAAIGESAQNLSLWRKRNTYGQSGEDRLHDVTGADIGWLRNRGNVAFPKGPTLNPNQNLQRLVGDVDQLRKALLEFAWILSENATTRALAASWKARLEDSGSAYYVAHGFQGMLLSVLDTYAGTPEAAPDAPPVHEAQAKTGRRVRK